MSETAENLRIIGRDATGMLPADRRILDDAADEYDALWRQMIATNQALIEAQAQRLAVQEKLREITSGEFVPLYSVTLHNGNSAARSAALS